MPNSVPIMHEIKSHYRSGRDSLASDFFVPCLAKARRYRRASGYFSSYALLTWLEALPRALDEDGFRIQLIASPELSPEDVATFKELSDEPRRAAYRQMLADRVLEQIAALHEQPNDQKARAALFAWLIANDRLEIRFAFATHYDDAGMFHEKIGIFDLENDEQIAFTGSANETLGGHHRNYESIDVYRSWHVSERDRIDTKIQQFDEAWLGKAVGLEVVVPSPGIVARLRAKAPEQIPKKPGTGRPPSEDPKWRHQSEAAEAFLAARAGVLEMATGTGKTRTAIKILSKLIDDGTITSAIVTTDGTDLLSQWSSELDAWNLATGKGWLIYRHFSDHRELAEYALDPGRSLLVISREQLHKVLIHLDPARRKSSIIIHDEVHGLAVPSNVVKLVGEHLAFGWRLGLSATPDRAYDAAGNAFLGAEIGPTLYRFPLESAIERGVLSPFDYVPLTYHLTAGDRARLKEVYAKQAARQRDGNPMSKEEVWTELSKVYKTAEQKPSVFRAFLDGDPSALKSSIIFVETKEYGNALLEMIHRHTHRYRTYYAEDDREHLVQFARGEIDCLITCHRISQGIDIKSLKNVILFASARAKLETIQRIGRCLRSDPVNPDKIARVIDFVRPAGEEDAFPNADQERATWLTELSLVRRKADA